MYKLYSVLTMEERYSVFIDTLNLLILPVKKINESYLVSVKHKFEELEGDYYTFLHEENILKLVASGYISIELVNPIAQIRKEISEIETELWNSSDFIENNKWKRVRELVVDLFEKEMVK